MAGDYLDGNDGRHDGAAIIKVRQLNQMCTLCTYMCHTYVIAASSNMYPTTANSADSEHMPSRKIQIPLHRVEKRSNFFLSRFLL